MKNVHNWKINRQLKKVLQNTTYMSLCTDIMIRFAHSP